MTTMASGSDINNGNEPQCVNSLKAAYINLLIQLHLGFTMPFICKRKVDFSFSERVGERVFLILVM